MVLQVHSIHTVYKFCLYLTHASTIVIGYTDMYIKVNSAWVIIYNSNIVKFKDSLKLGWK